MGLPTHPECCKTGEKRQDILIPGQIVGREDLLEISGKHGFCLLRQGLMWPRLASNLLYSHSVFELLILLYYPTQHWVACAHCCTWRV